MDLDIKENLRYFDCDSNARSAYASVFSLLKLTEPFSVVNNRCSQTNLYGSCGQHCQVAVVGAKLSKVKLNGH